MDYLLIVVKGRSANTTLKLNDGVTLVGRHDDCQLRIKSSQVSRRHCEIFEKKGLLLVKDLGSSNGTYVNGKRIEQQQVLEAGLGPPPATPPKPPTPAPVAETKPKPKPEPKTEPAPPPPAADSPAEDAIADFLLDIKFDEDE